MSRTGQPYYVRRAVRAAAALLLTVLTARAEEAESIVSKYKMVMTEWPTHTPADNAVDGPLLGNGEMLMAIGGWPQSLRFFINRNDLWILRPINDARPQTLARLDLALPEFKDATFKIEQDLFSAVTSGTLETKTGKKLLMETAVLATDNIAWIRLEAVNGSISGTMTLHPGNTNTQPTLRSGSQYVERRFDQDVLKPSGAACVLRNLNGSEGSSFTLEPGKPIVLIVSSASVFDSKDMTATAMDKALGMTADRLTELRKQHAAWWRDFWNKSFVEIPDKVIEQRYYLSQYVLGSACRNKDFPPGLFGWVTLDVPKWNGDYHMNYNHVAPFYGLYAANHIEQADTCTGPILANYECSRELCRKDLGVDGLYQYVGIGPLGSIGGRLMLMQKSNSSYSCVPIMFRWYATYDLDYAKKTYPWVRGVAEFWKNWLKFENGRYVDYLDAIHEGSGDNVNPILSLGLIKMVMNLALDMSAELGVDADQHEKWIHIRDHLSDWPTDNRNRLPIFRYTEKGTQWWGDNTLGIQHIFPAGAIGLDSPKELLERSCNMVTVMSRWIDNNGMNSFYAAAARVGYDPKIILEKMREMLEIKGYPNGMIKNNPHGMEHQSIVPNAIQEMLLQSHENVIRFFPCWPKDQDARFGTLRARGAFLVSAELKGGVVGGVTILSEKGRDCTVLNPWPGKKVQLEGREVVSGERFTFKTKTGEVIKLCPVM